MSERLDIVLQSMLESDKTAALVKLARAMAHELNNIFTVAVGNPALLDETVPGDEPMAETIAEVRHAIERGIALSTGLQEFTRGQSFQREPLVDDAAPMSVARSVPDNSTTTSRTP